MKRIDFPLHQSRSDAFDIVNGALRHARNNPTHDYCSSTSLPSLYSNRRNRDKNDRPSRLPLSASSGRTSAGTSRTSEVADLHHVQLRRCGPYRAICGFDRGNEFALRRVNAQPRRIAGGERDHRRARVDHETELPAVDPAVDQEVTARVTRHDDRARTLRRGRGPAAGCTVSAAGAEPAVTRVA